MKLDWLKKSQDQPAVIRHGWIGAHANLNTLDFLIPAIRQYRLSHLDLPFNFE